jgi:hypothetical protein
VDRPEFLEPRLSLAGSASESRHELYDRGIKVGIGSGRVDVTSRHGQAPGRRKPVSLQSAAVSAKHDFPRKRIAGEAEDFRELIVQEAG